MRIKTGRKPLFLALGFCFIFLCCDLLRHSPYEVEAWTPGEGFHSDPARIRPSLLLSHESDRAKTEQAFSLTEDRKTLKGDFSWEGARLVFIPASPLESGRDYVITLGTGAQDTKGISLDKKFEVSFTTRNKPGPPGGKPEITRVSPQHGGCLSDSRGEFRLYFSQPVCLVSCMDYISFSPAASGVWRLEDEDKTACFIPREPWQAGDLYRITVDGDFPSASGAVLGTGYSSVFSVWADREKPVLLRALAVEGNNSQEISIEEPGASTGAGYVLWERSTALELVFSEPVDLGVVRNLLVTEPAAALVMESSPELSDRALFRFDPYPDWGSSVLFRLGPGVKDSAGNESDGEYLFRIVCAGPLSKAPVLEGMRLPAGNIAASYGDAGNPELESFSPGDIFQILHIKHDEAGYPFDKETFTWIELYFETAPDTEIDLFTLMDLFRLESTNNAFKFSPRSIVTENFSRTSPKEGWENLQRVEIRGFLTNTIYSGVVSFRIPPGLKDMRGNRSTTDFRISLLK